MKFHRFLLVVRACLLCLALDIGDARADVIPEMDAKIAELARRVLASTDGALVAVGAFTDTGEGTNFGPGLEEKLREALNREAHRQIVSDQAPYIVKGDYSFSKVRNRPELDGRKVIKVSARLIEREFNEPIDEVPFTITIEENLQIASILQISGAIEFAATATTPKLEQRQNEAIEQLHTQPSCHVHGTGNTRVSSSEGSSFSVEVHVDGQPLPIRIENGQAHVTLDVGSAYTIHLFNRNAEEKAKASITIDGLDAFHFADPTFRDENGRPTPTGYVIPAARSSLQLGHTFVPGWFVKVDAPGNYHAFRVASYGGEDDAERLEARGKLGVIHVRFAREQRSELVRSLAARDPKRTVAGEKIDVDGVTMDKNTRFGPFVDFIAIRYSR